MKPEDVEGFPFDNPKARLKLVSGNWTVIVRTYFRRDGKPRQTARAIGRVVDGRYVPIEDYRRLYARGGKRREEPRPSRGYERKKPAPPKPRQAEMARIERKHPLPDRSEVEGFPDIPKARMVWGGPGLVHVVLSTYSRVNGRSVEKRRYIGKIKDGRYYSQEEYRRLFRHGRRVAGD